MFTKDDRRMVTSIYNSKMTTFFFDVDINLPDDDICVYVGYQLHTLCVGTRLCIMSSLLCEPVSHHVAIVTSSGSISSH